MKKLFIFDKTTKRIVGAHFFWEDGWVIEDKWRTFDPANQIALVLNKDIPAVIFDNEGTKDQATKVIQPKSYGKIENTEYKYILESDLPEIPQDEQ